MIRYTVEVESRDEGFKIESIKEILEKHLIRKVTAYKIKAAQIQLNGVILLTTDLSTGKLLELLYTIKNQISSIRHISARFGWDVPSSFKGIIHLKDEEKDPHFHLIKVQPEKEMIYTYSRLGWIYLIISYIFLVAIGTMIQNASVFPLLISIGLFTYSIFNIIPSIKCNETGIEFRYLLRPRLRVAWSEIQFLRIVIRRGEWCIIQRIDGKTEFPLSEVYTNEKMLIKTIIEKANLHFMGLSSDITYSRSNHIG